MEAIWVAGAMAPARQQPGVDNSYRGAGGRRAERHDCRKYPTALAGRQPEWCRRFQCKMVQRATGGRGCRLGVSRALEEEGEFRGRPADSAVLSCCAAPWSGQVLLLCWWLSGPRGEKYLSLPLQMPGAPLKRGGAACREAPRRAEHAVHAMRRAALPAPPAPAPPRTSRARCTGGNRGGAC